MKRFILASTLIAISANATVIFDEVSYSTQITPDMMTSSFTITKKAKSPSQILDSFKSINEHLKEFNNKGIKCVGGASNVSPEYKYTNNVQTHIGYVGSISYSCEFKKIEKYNEALDIKLAKDEVISLNPINWVVSSQMRTQIDKELEYDIYQKSMSKSVELSKIFNKNCKLEEVNFLNQTTIYPTQRFAMKSMSVATDAISEFEPIQSEQTISKKAYITIKCE